MINVWGKIFVNEKIIKHSVVSVEPKECTFFDMLKQLCEKLDIPTPVLLNKHLSDFNQFSMTVFKLADFVESINFDRLVIEYLPEQ